MLTGTSFHTERRAELARAVREAGGALHKELTEECTHLVVADDLETSRKVDACKTHESLQRVHVVSASWLDRSARPSSRGAGLRPRTASQLVFG